MRFQRSADALFARSADALFSTNRRWLCYFKAFPVAGNADEFL